MVDINRGYNNLVLGDHRNEIQSPYSIQTWVFTYPKGVTADHLFESFRKAYDFKWLSSLPCRQLCKMLWIMPIPENMSIDKVICFGLGSIHHHYQPDTNNLLCPSNALYQHCAAISMADIIKQRTGSKCKILMQDPHYNDIDKEVLGRYDVQTIGDYGAAGFAEVDENSLVFTMYPSALVTEILADLPRPAAYLCDHFCGGTSFRRRLAKEVAFPTTPRVESMAVDYHHHDKIAGQIGWGINGLQVNFRLEEFKRQVVLESITQRWKRAFQGLLARILDFLLIFFERMCSTACWWKRTKTDVRLETKTV